MLNFREFEAGPDPFGRKFQVFFKWMQTAISLRHADTVDVKFLLIPEHGEHDEHGENDENDKGGKNDEGGGRTQKTIALPNADLLRVSQELKRPMDDAWCSRIAAMHLLHLVETGEDMEKDLVTLVTPDVKRYAEIIAKLENSEVHAR